jgi:hypothetical protein
LGCGPGQGWFCLSGGWGDGDVKAEGPQLAQVGADLAVAVGVVVVPAGAQVGEPDIGISQQMPDDEQDRPSDGALGFVPVEPPGQAADAVAEERLGAGSAVSGLVQ